MESIRHFSWTTLEEFKRDSVGVGMSFLINGRLFFFLKDNLCQKYSS